MSQFSTGIDTIGTRWCANASCRNRPKDLRGSDFSRARRSGGVYQPFPLVRRDAIDTKPKWETYYNAGCFPMQFNKVDAKGTLTIKPD